MQNKSRIPAALIAAAAMIAVTALSAATSRAAELSYAPGSRIGLVVIDGLKPSSTFPGFEDPDRGVSVVAAELPESAYAAVEAALQQNPQAPGPKPERFETALGQGYLSRQTAEISGESTEQFALVARAGKASAFVTVQVPKKAAAAYSEDAVLRMLKSVALRAEVPVDEQFRFLPFEITDLAGFRTVRTLAPGRVVLLSDGLGDDALENPTSIIVSVIQGTPGSADDRGRFARQMIESVPGLKDARITSSEPLRIGGSPGYETRIEAIMARTNTPIVMVQWIRFGTGAFLHMLGAAPRDDWDKVFPRLRAVRDSVEVK